MPAQPEEQSMRTKIRRITFCGAAALMMTGVGTYSWAQNSGGGPNMMGGYGPGMMGEYSMGPWMMNGYGPNYQQPGNGQSILVNPLDAIKQELKITSDQEPAWKTYADAVTAAEQTLKSSMRSAMQSAASTPMTPDSRFAFMDQMVALQKQSYDEQHKAAEALLPKLTEYQSGQASMVLPGLAQNTGAFPGYGGYGMGPWMMGS
jgi:LTXXQ motif family protein